MAENVLNLFRKQFLKDVDASVVIGELKQSGIVPQSCQEKISKADGYRQRNEILHDCLKRTCTRDALMMACDIIIELAGGEEDGEGGNPNMKKVGEAMKMKLETGSLHVPGVSNGAAQTNGQATTKATRMAFAIITANATEQKVVRHFFKLGRDAGEVWSEAAGCDYTSDFYLKREGVKVEFDGTPPSVHGYDFEVFTVSSETEKVIGIHVRCLQQAANTDGGSRKTTNALLDFAKSRNLQLELIFSVGCCGLSAEDKSEHNVHKMMGRVLLSNVYEAFLDRGKVTVTGKGEDAKESLKFHSQFHKGAREWVARLEEHSITQPGQHTDDDTFRFIPVAEVPRFVTGPVVIKSTQFGDEVRGNASIVGIEMEASGIASALDDWADRESTLPKFLLLKGVSDFGSNKGDVVKASFFGKPTAEKVSDDIRQQIATFHCIALVARGVAKVFLCTKKLPDVI